VCFHNSSRDFLGRGERTCVDHECSGQQGNWRNSLGDDLARGPIHVLTKVQKRCLKGFMKECEE
jgi:hypothetical protein